MLMIGLQARQFADWMNEGNHAKEAGLTRLPINNPSVHHAFFYSNSKLCEQPTLIY